MQRWREQYLGLVEFPPAMASAEIDQFFTLSGRELTAVRKRRRSLNRLGVALQIGFRRMTDHTLNSFQIIPVAVLEHLGVQLQLTPPRVASIRALYRRQRTLFDHQHAVMAALGFRHLTDHAERGLTAHLRRSAETTFGVDVLTTMTRIWHFEHGYVLPGDKRVRLLVGAALRHAEHTLCERIATQFNSETVARWLQELTAPKDGATKTVLEWLRDPPHRAGRRDIADYVERVQFLRELTVCSVLPEHYGMTSRRYAMRCWNHGAMGRPKVRSTGSRR